MPLQNRVDPFGNLVAVSARGEFFGNRGILHNQDKVIVSPWKHKSWVTCLLSFKGIKRELFSPNNYSELFFLDEATALSAGHRPCAHCRRDRYNEFKMLWLTANSESPDNSLSVAQIDKQLHSERAGENRDKKTFLTAFKNIAQGTFITIAGNAYLFWEGALLKWSHHGYVEALDLPGANEEIEVITPYSIVQLFKHGFTPSVHSSAHSV